MKTKIVLTVLLSAFLADCFAQDDESNVIENMYRPKLAQFSYESLFEHQTSSSSESFGDANHELKRENLFKAKIGVPLYMKGNKLFGMQLGYSEQRFNFDTDEQVIDYDLYRYLNSTTFYNGAVRFLYKQDFSATRSLTLYSGFEMKSDRWQLNANSGKFFIGGIYMKVLNSRTQIGYGAIAGYELGVYSLWPLLKYEHKITNKFTLDLTLPKSAAVRYKINNKSYLIAKTQVSGWRYNLDGSFNGGQDDFTLRKADLQTTLTLEREIHDWLWISFEAGFNKNIRYYLAEPGGRNRDALIGLRPNDAAYAKVNLFIVPPWKLCQPKNP